jgi:gamma-glutamyltranspeptidase/glutathione hydrolase
MPVIARGWGMAGKGVAVTADTAMVVTGHPLATAVGVETLRRGGNAVDAAVAVAFALAVVLPDAGNIGGGGFLVYRGADGRTAALDYREAAPAAATRDMYLDAQGNPTDQSTLGHRASGVPGSVAGLWEMHRRYGTRPWADLLAPAVRLARDGHLVDARRSAGIADVADDLRRFPASRRQFLPNGRPPAEGSTWRQPDLARTLQLISDSGPAVFYRGQIADSIVAEMARGGGLITRADLAAYRAKWRSPIRLTYRGHTVISMPPPSSGGVTMGEILNIMATERALPPFGSTALLHLEAEAMRRAFTDRNTLLGDPDFVDMPLARLLSRSYAAQLRAGIDPRRATPTRPFAAASEGAHTTHYSVVDRFGNAAAVTTTLNDSYGSKVTVSGAGFLLNDEMDDFATAPGRPNMYGLVQGEANAIAPRKRMLSAMTPTIVLDPAGRLFLVAGSPGGPRIITAVYHLVSNVIDHDMPLADAVAAPRLHHQALPDSISLERGGIVPAVQDSLRALGHGVREWGYRGLVMAIQRRDGRWVGVADPRTAGAAQGY